MAQSNEGLFIGEAIFMLVLLGAFLSLFTYNDIVVHDGYALPLGAMCYEGNKIPQCIPVQQMHNCPTGGDACIEMQYAAMVTMDAVGLSSIMIFIKIGIAKLARRKIDGPRIVQALIWGATPLVLLWTGWEDFLYFVSRNQSVPTNMDWMNNSGLFPYVDNYILHVQQATAMSLYIVMAVGFAIVMTMIYLNMKMTVRAGRVTPI